jgi:hypothetical protein
MENKKLKKLLLVLLLLLLLFYGVYAILIKNSAPDVLNNQEAEEVENAIEPNLTPEDVLKQLEGDDSLGQEIQISIVSPEGESFTPSQARMWQAELENIESETSFGVNCHWKFYINENNEEVLYQEMENRSGVSKDNPQICGFTSTFIDRIGKLRVVLDAEILNSSGDVLETYTAEREYIVK